MVVAYDKISSSVMGMKATCHKFKKIGGTQLKKKKKKKKEY